jgi:hypothetical protein
VAVVEARDLLAGDGADQVGGAERVDGRLEVGAEVVVGGGEELDALTRAWS